MVDGWVDPIYLRYIKGRLFVVVLFEERMEERVLMGRDLKVRLEERSVFDVLLLGEERRELIRRVLLADDLTADGMSVFERGLPLEEERF